MERWKFKDLKVMKQYLTPMTDAWDDCIFTCMKTIKINHEKNENVGKLYKRPMDPSWGYNNGVL